MTAPVLVARHGGPRPARFGALVAGFTGAPVRVVGVHASDEEIDRLSGAQLGEDLECDSGGALDEVAGRLAEGIDVETISTASTSAPLHGAHAHGARRALLDLLRSAGPPPLAGQHEGRAV